MIRLCNIENIIAQFKEDVNYDMVKFDGISLEVTIPLGGEYDKISKEYNKLCKKYKLLPVSIHPNKVTDTLMLVEFPELEPYYTEEQNTKMYTDSINWLIQDYIKASSYQKIKVTKQMVLDSMDIFVSESMKMYFKSNMNQYKAEIEKFLINPVYRTPVEKLFREIVRTYIFPR